ncbi:EcoKI restriction-modification system protein HsdS [uncultured Clostridium sp.]|uniref:hypothetical protein n=1 Tax=uncultured Clostridium sp. TaxID=59620 RepID=UPI000821899F|nr:hypothetical protein [uncultured Clostridium sp.]SCK01421.1 EcoKI restriction-modification system protein HsdS [uncultured Clostridium sp.]
MLSSKTVRFKNFKKEDRFDPKFFFLEDKFEKYKKNDKLSVLKLGDKDLLKVITDGEHAGQKFVDKGVLFIKNSAIKDFHISRGEGFYIEEWKHEEQKRSALEKDDILFTTIGHLGSATLVPENLGEANINQNLVKIKIDSSILSPAYLVAYLNSTLTKMQINAMFTGNIQGILTYPKIKNIDIVYPADKKIVDEIDTIIRKAINLDNESFDLIEEARRLFVDSLNIDRELVDNSTIFNISLKKLKNSSDLWIPKKFNPEFVTTLEIIKSKFKYIELSNDSIDIISGDEAGSDNYSNYMDKNDGDVPFIRTSDLFNHELDLHPDNYIPIEIFEELEQDIRKGDILFTKDGKIGITAMISGDEKVVLSSGISRIRIKDNSELPITNEYLFVALSSKEIGKYQTDQRVVYASTIPHLRPERLKEFIIPIIEKKSIDKITSIVKEAYKKKEEKNKLLRKAITILQDCLE